MALPSACDLGRCTETHTIEGRYKFEDKVYPYEDAVMIQKATFAQTQILAHNRLEGEVSTSAADDQAPFVTFHTGIKAGTKVRLYRDEIVSNGWYSEINGYGAEQCGFVGQSTRREVQIDKFIGAKKVRQEEELCMSKMIGTWKQGLMGAGALREGEEVFLSDEILYAMIKESMIGIDRHAWRGDYGSADSRYMHTDGFIKIAVDATATAKAAIVTHAFTGLQAGDSIEGMVGGQSFKVDFDTDTNTTLDALVTELESYEDIYGNAIFPTVAHNNAGLLTVTGQKAQQYQLKFVITDGNGFDLCPDGSLTPKAAGNATVTTTVTQEAAGGNEPISIDLVAITSSNVKDRLRELYSAISSTKPELLDPDFGGTLFVANNVWNMLELALSVETVAYTGSPAGLKNQRQFMGFNIVKMNYLPPNEMFYARAADLHVATDLVNDVTEIMQGYDPKCGTAWFKNAFSLGFQISETANIAGTFGSRPVDEFQSLMPLDNQ